MCFGDFDIDTQPNVLSGLPLQEPEVRCLDPAGNSASSPLHHDKEELDVKGVKCIEDLDWLPALVYKVEQAWVITILFQVILSSTKKKKQ